MSSASADVLCRTKEASRGEAMKTTMNGASGSVGTNGRCDSWAVYSLTPLTMNPNDQEKNASPRQIFRLLRMWHRNVRREHEGVGVISSGYRFSMQCSS